MTTQSILAPIASLALPDQASLTQRAQSALDFIDSYEVIDQESYEMAGDELRAVKTRTKLLEEQRTSITGPLNNALRAVNALFAGPARLLEQAEGKLKLKMSGYVTAVERAQAEQRRVAEEAAAAERAKAAAIAAEAEAAAKAAVAQAEAAAATGDESAAAIAQAAVQRAKDEAAAASIAAQVIVAPAPVASMPKAAGISSRTKVDIEVVDLVELVRHVAQHSELIGLLKPNDTALRAYARSLGTAAQLPGTRLVESTVMSARAA